MYTRKRIRSFRMVHGKLVKIQHSPATVSAENRAEKPLFRTRNGKAADLTRRKSGDRPASRSSSALEGGARDDTLHFRACWPAFLRLAPARLSGGRRDQRQSHRPVRRARPWRAGRHRQPRRRRRADHRRRQRQLPVGRSRIPGHAAGSYRHWLQHSYPAPRSGGQRTARNRPADRFRAGGGVHHRNPLYLAGVQCGRNSQQPRAVKQRTFCPGSVALRSRRGLQSNRRPRRSSPACSCAAAIPT